MADGAAADVISKSANRRPAKTVANVLSPATAGCDPYTILRRQMTATHLLTCSFPTAATKNHPGRGRDEQAGRRLTRSTRLPMTAGSASENFAGYFALRSGTAPAISRPW